MSPALKKTAPKTAPQAARKAAKPAGRSDARTVPSHPVRRVAALPPPLPPPPHTLTHAALVEYLGASAVTELVVVEFAPGQYRLEASLSWRSGKSVLVAARGERSFRSLDTVATLLRTIGVGHTLVRLELKA